MASDPKTNSSRKHAKELTKTTANPPDILLNDMEDSLVTDLRWKNRFLKAKTRKNQRRTDP
jgi:hypothetical protein